jgi:hypothetical protein
MKGHQEQAPLTGAFRRCKAIMEALPLHVETDDLCALIEALRELQKPIGDTFWDLEKQIARLGDELERRTSCLL